MIIHSNLCKMKNKILPICLQGNYRDSSIQQYVYMACLGLGGKKGSLTALCILEGLLARQLSYNQEYL